MARKNRITAIAIAAAVCAALVFFTFRVFLPELRYRRAVSLKDAGRYDEAVSAFRSLDGYRDSQRQTRSCILADSAYDDLRRAEPGDTVFFGIFPQGRYPSFKEADVEWQVLARENGHVLLISRYGLDNRLFHDSHRVLTWEDAALRTWLNTDFLNTAFTPEEQLLISVSCVPADRNPDYGADPGRETLDRVFLLSIREAEKYFPDNSARRCEGATPYALANGALTAYNGSVWWWLRTPGYVGSSAACVAPNGQILTDGDTVDIACNTVRPALWVDLNT